MKSLLCVLSFFQLLSCSGYLAPSSEDKDPHTKNSKISIEPKIYLSKEDQFIPLKKLNRENITLNLSDKITFSDEKANQPNSHFKSLKKFEKDKNLKFKVSSFCSYEKNKTENIEPNRSFQEIGGSFYRWSFSIFELIPKEILLNGLDKIFYCSFIFAFKDSEETFNHYNIAQQPISPYFNSERANKLFLVRETESGHYFPLGNELIESKNIPKILILNETRFPIKSYHLFCEGLKIADFNLDSNGKNIFAQLMTYDLDSLPEGIKKCRIFSENEYTSIGMTDSFLLDFESLKNNKAVIDLKTIAEPVIALDGLDRKYKNGDKIPLNSYFHFNSLDTENKNNSIDMTVHTQCVDAYSNKQNKLLSKTYHFPFRKKIPVMAVTPKQTFFMPIGTSSYNKWLKFLEKYKKKMYSKRTVETLLKNKQSYGNNCIYKISLQDRYNQKNKKEFNSRSYFIKWTENAYGIDEIIFDIYIMISPAYEMVVDSFSKRNYSSNEKVERLKKPFFSLTEDIYTNRIGYLNLNLFDVIDDSLFQIEGSKLDKMILSCSSRKKKASIVLEWPYSLQNNSISLKTLFLNPDLRNYIQKEKISACRLFLYEKDILRYFSEEMRIVK